MKITLANPVTTTMTSEKNTNNNNIIWTTIKVKF